jgi:uncharacterized protein YyaL (SSP411 family)
MLRAVSALLVSILVCAQPAFAIKWEGWTDDLFQRAKAENKFVILDLEAVWCHWCHVMDEKTYNNPEVQKLMADKYIAVRVDQDSRPDLSNKYEDYGWPATIIFRADGAELVKRAGYIEPEEMISLLKEVIRNPTPGPSVSAKSKVVYATAGALPAALRKELMDKHLKGYDTKYGSWGTFQKFLDADSVELSLQRAKAGDARAREMARFTLEQQNHLLDPVWGGMYQYSTHGDWAHPHFEKIMQVQGENLKVYAQGYELLGDPKLLTTAKSIYKFLTTMLMGPDGAFYTSQDADIVKGKHSDWYFKLSDAERRKYGIPRIDKHVYARENGWAINGIVNLYMATGDKQYLDTALRAADWIVAHRALPDGGFAHGNADTSGPFLGDSLYMGRAMLSLYAATGDRAWLKRAEDAAGFIAKHFAATAGGAGYVTVENKPGSVIPADALLGENVDLARFANLLYRYSGNKEYRTIAENSMRFLATPEVARQRRVLVAGTLLADRELSRDPVHITVLGSKKDPAAQALFKKALSYPLSYKVVEFYDKTEGPLPTQGDLQFPDLPVAAAFGCAGGRCSLPIKKPENIQKTIDLFSAADSTPR